MRIEPGTDGWGAQMLPLHCDTLLVVWLYWSFLTSLATIAYRIEKKRQFCWHHLSKAGLWGDFCLQWRHSSEPILLQFFVLNYELGHARQLCDDHNLKVALHLIALHLIALYLKALQLFTLHLIALKLFVLQLKALQLRPLQLIALQLLAQQLFTL